MKQKNEICIDKKSKKNNLYEKVFRNIFLVCACFSILCVVIIIVFIFKTGAPAFFEIGMFDFIFGSEWNPSANAFGILTMIVASILGTLGAVIVGALIGVFVAIFLAELSPKWLYKIIKPAIELLAGIPSVVYGFFGLMIIVPNIQKIFNAPDGHGLLAVIFILIIMILPTIVNISENAIRSVPREFKEGSLAIGASHIQTIFKVLIPSAKSGILSSIVLGTGRAIGETMAVILVAGCATRFPTSLTSSVRTLTANIALEMGYATGLHREALFATGIVLFLFIMIINIILTILINKGVKNNAE